MNLTTHKLLAAIGITLAAICAFIPRSTAGGAGHESAASAPPDPGLKMQWFHSHGEVILANDQHVETNFARHGRRRSRVDGRPSVTSQKSFDLSDVRTVPALHAIRVTVDGEELQKLHAAAATDPRIRYVSRARPDAPHAEPAERPAAAERRSRSPRCRSSGSSRRRTSSTRSSSRPATPGSRSASSTPASTSCPTSRARSTGCTTSGSTARSPRRRRAATTTTATAPRSPR